MMRNVGQAPRKKTYAAYMCVFPNIIYDRGRVTSIGESSAQLGWDMTSE